MTMPHVSRKAMGFETHLEEAVLIDRDSTGYGIVGALGLSNIIDKIWTGSISIIVIVKL